MDRIIIAGAGALGSFLAAKFLASGTDVFLIARGARLSFLRKNGLLIALDGAVYRYPVKVSESCTFSGAADSVMLACKSRDLPDMAANLQMGLSAGTVVMTVQNGVDAPDLVARTFPQANVFASRMHGFFELEDGIVRHVGVEPSVVFGRVYGSSAQAERHLTKLLSRAQIEHRISADIRKELWEKMLLAASVGGVGAAYGISAGQILRHPEASALLRELMEEIHALARRKGIPLGPCCVQQNLSFVASFPEGATTSMQRDLEEGRPSEYQCLTGAVLRMATEEGLNAPACLRTDAMLRARGLIE